MSRVAFRLIAVFSLVATAVSSPCVFAQQTDIALQGAWDVVEVSKDGKPFDMPKMDEVWTFESYPERQVRVDYPDSPGVSSARYSFQINTSSNPRRIDMLHSDGKTRKWAIYEMSGDKKKLKVAYDDFSGQHYPQGFEPQSGKTGARIIILVRRPDDF